MGENYPVLKKFHGFPCLLLKTSVSLNRFLTYCNSVSCLLCTGNPWRHQGEQRLTPVMYDGYRKIHLVHQGVR